MEDPKRVEGDEIHGDKVGGDKVMGDKTVIVQKPPEEPPDLDALRETYLAHLRRTYRHLDFKGIPQVERVATFLPLDGVYVGLQARPDPPPVRPGPGWPGGRSMRSPWPKWNLG
jgi:hypothetical protein